MGLGFRRACFGHMFKVFKRGLRRFRVQGLGIGLLMFKRVQGVSGSGFWRV